MPLCVEPLNEAHLADAAALVARRYAELRAMVPDLPPRREDPAVILPMLADITPRSPGAVALRDGRLVGFMNCCLIIRDEGTASITGAFTVEEARGQGVGAAVLARAIQWARDEGYCRPSPTPCALFLPA